MLLPLLETLDTKATSLHQLRMQLTKAGSIIITFKLEAKD